MLRRRRPDPLLTREELNGLLAIVMRIDQRTKVIHAYLLEDDDGEETEDRP